MYVQRGIYETFLERFIPEVKRLKVGDPLDTNTKMGPVVSKEHQNKIEKYLQYARDENNEVITGGEFDEKLTKGYYLLPTVVLNVNDQSKLMTEEIFGPVVCIVIFDTEEDLIKRVNNIQYGLCGCIWTENLGRAHRLAQHIEVRISF